jgi:hypothetical protein
LKIPAIFLFTRKDRSLQMNWSSACCHSPREIAESRINFVVNDRSNVYGECPTGDFLFVNIPALESECLVPQTQIFAPALGRPVLDLLRPQVLSCQSQFQEPQGPSHD